MASRRMASSGRITGASPRPRRRRSVVPGQPVQDLRLLAVQAEQVGLVADGQAAQVADVFPQRQLAVDVVPGRGIGDEGVVLRHQLRAVSASKALRSSSVHQLRSAPPPSNCEPWSSKP